MIQETIYERLLQRKIPNSKKDRIKIGRIIANKFYRKFHYLPNKVEQVENRKTLFVFAYPESYFSTMDRLIDDFYEAKKERMLIAEKQKTNKDKDNESVGQIIEEENNLKVPPEQITKKRKRIKRQPIGNKVDYITKNKS